VKALRTLARAVGLRRPSDANRRDRPRLPEPAVPITGAVYSALAISNEMIVMGMRRSAMGHNKLVQIVQGNALALGRSIIPELPEIWRYGPVLRTLYLIQNHLGHAIIDRPLQAGPFDAPARVDPDDEWTLSLIRRIVDGHACVSTLDLSSLLHAEGTPWKDEAIRFDFSVPVGTTVPQWRIADHYGRRIAA